MRLYVKKRIARDKHGEALYGNMNGVGREIARSTFVSWLPKKMWIVGRESMWLSGLCMG